MSKPAPIVIEDNTNKTMMLLLQSISFTGKFIVEYSGSGDSGQVDDIFVEDPLVTKEFLEKNFAPSNVCEFMECQEGTTYWLLLDRWADKLVGGVGYDWYNNEGGGGTITAEPASGMIKVDGYYNAVVQKPVVEDMSMDPEDPLFTHDHGGASVLEGEADG